MAGTIINYDELSDTLYVSFAPGEKATGIELNEHILLRINKAERRPVGLTFFEYSLLAQVTEMGIRSFPLSGLADLPDDLREMVLEMLLHEPVSDVLAISACTPPAAETILITLLRALPLAA
jgi:uncharacterized protein YuzE